MKKVTGNEAKNLLHEGKLIKAFVSRTYKPVKSETELSNYINLDRQKVQPCEFFLDEFVKLPENAIEVSFDEAFKLIINGEKVYCLNQGEEELISTRTQLISYYRSASARMEALLYTR